MAADHDVEARIRDEWNNRPKLIMYTAWEIRMDKQISDMLKDRDQRQTDCWGVVRGLQAQLDAANATIGEMTNTPAGPQIAALKSQLAEAVRERDRILKLQQNDRRELEQRGHKIADAMGRHRGTDNLISAVKQLSENYSELLDKFSLQGVEVRTYLSQLAELQTENDLHRGRLDACRIMHQQYRDRIAELEAMLENKAGL